jgi:UDP-N-acetylglucosamine 4-epimerase
MNYIELKQHLSEHKYTWLVTGVAGFIGSHLLESLLKLNQRVIGLDNFATGYKHNLEKVLEAVSPETAKDFTFYEGSICSSEDCEKAMQGVDYVLHQAALGSVPRSIKDPITTNEVNLGGFIKLLTAAKNQKVKRFVYASSSSVYGDSEALPKVENTIGNQLSPYAVSKYANELYAEVFSRCYGIETIGLRYFNVFGARQDPTGAYAAVIPLWFKALLNGDTVYINGDGETTRDFCYVENAVQANLLAALTNDKEAVNTAYNIAVGEQISLNELFKSICTILKSSGNHKLEYKEFRLGDVRHSLADISKAKRLIKYNPLHTVQDGLQLAADWYKHHFLNYTD